MRIISKLLKLTSISFILLAMISCSDDDDVVIITPDELNIVETALETPELSSLVAALQAADGDLVAVLNGPGPFTVLAPTNDAFSLFLTANGFASLDDVPTDVLSQILLNHVISAEVSSSALIGIGSGYADSNATGAGNSPMSLYFDTSNGVRFNNVSTVTTADVEASNGTIHIVNGVIGLPTIVDHAVANSDLSSLVSALTFGGNTTFTDLLSMPGDFTVFAPTNAAFDAFTNPNSNDIDNILSNHVIVGATAVSSGLSNGYVSTAGMNGDGDALSLYINTDSGVTINGISDVDKADVIASNGVIHVVNTVIDLPTVVTFAAADPNFSNLLAALTRSDQPDFAGILSTPDGTSPAPFTVFAPVDTAFEALLNSNDDWDSLADIDGMLLTSVLQHHVIVEANIRAEDLTDGVMPATLEGDNITINLPGNDGNAAKITDGSGTSNIDIIAVNVQANNGVIHATESVLIPDTTN
ncbi:MAG: hypothetical protein BM564_00170 [Bacteroidetes bacterium MedPE-SWsnd-G2]|nr:MAG: hypothetical protein BM564_00170 [Bacteroidetes bacterium MedPE-SWsnd-G2]